MKGLNELERKCYWDIVSKEAWANDPLVQRVCNRLNLSAVDVRKLIVGHLELQCEYDDRKPIAGLLERDE